MTFTDFLTHFRRIWYWSAATSVGCVLFPIFVATTLPQFVPIGGMCGLGERRFNPFEFSLWLLHVGTDCCLVSAVIASAAGVTYLIGKTIAVPRARPPLDISLRCP
jgi:hypothetical protein